MVKIPDHLIYSVDYQYKIPATFGPNWDDVDYGTGMVHLNVDDYNQLRVIIAPLEGDEEYASRAYDLNKEQVRAFVKYLKGPLPMDFDKYDYFLAASCTLEYFEALQKAKEDALPEPKSVLALAVLEKGEEYGIGVMPLYKVDVQRVRDFYKMPLPQNFDFDDRVDQKMYEFIRTMQDCKNIDLEKYDYRPAIWSNVFERDKGEMNIITCEE